MNGITKLAQPAKPTVFDRIQRRRKYLYYKSKDEMGLKMLAFNTCFRHALNGSAGFAKKYTIPQVRAVLNNYVTNGIVPASVRFSYYQRTSKLRYLVLPKSGYSAYEQIFLAFKTLDSNFDPYKYLVYDDVNYVAGALEAGPIATTNLVLLQEWFAARGA